MDIGPLLRYRSEGEDVQQHMTRSLYDRVGGESAIQAAVDLFYEKVMSDPLVNVFFLDLDMEAQVRKMVAFMAWAFDGPIEYRGRDLGEAHRGLVLRGLGDVHFDAVARHLDATLRELGIAPDVIAEIAAIVESTRNAVLSRVP